jgi:hypothetical protein
MLASILGDGATSSLAVWIARAFDALVTVGVDVDDVVAEPELREVDVPQPTTSTDRTTAPRTTERLIATSEQTLL